MAANESWAPAVPLEPLTTFGSDRLRWWHGEPGADCDQCGAMIWLDEDVWLKAGIEVIDGAPHLSVVVTSQFSDRSLMPWPGLSARVRLHKVPAPAGNCVIVEACAHEKGAPRDAPGDWRVVRIAPLAHELDQWERTAPHWHSGVYCFAPISGPCRAVFDHLELKARGNTPLPHAQATAVPRETPPVEADPDAAKASKLALARRMGGPKPPNCDPDDPEGKYPANWPYHLPDNFEFLR